MQQLGAGHDDWVHDGFVSPQQHHASIDYQYALGFQNSPHSQNFPHPQQCQPAMPPCSEYDEASVSEPPLPSQHLASARRMGRPWVKASRAHQPSVHDGNSIQEGNARVPNTEAHTTSPDASFSSSSSSESDDGDMAYSSDESLYGQGFCAPTTRIRPSISSSSASKVVEKGDGTSWPIISTSNASANCSLSGTGLALDQRLKSVALLPQRSSSQKSSQSFNRTAGSPSKGEDVKEPGSSAALQMDNTCKSNTRSHKAESEVQENDEDDEPLSLVKAELESGSRPIPDISKPRNSSTKSSRSDKMEGTSSLRSFQTSDAASIVRHTSSKSTIRSNPAPLSHSSSTGKLAKHNATTSSVKQKTSMNLPGRDKSSHYMSSNAALPSLSATQGRSGHLNIRRGTRPRAAVQYIALNDIVGADDDNDDNNNRAELDICNANGEKSNCQLVNAKNGNSSNVGSADSFATGSSSGGTLMELLHDGTVEPMTASTDHSGSKARISRVVPEDYGDIDQLLLDLEGIMNGSMAARRRFSLALMRQSLAVDHGLVEPLDYSQDKEEVLDDAAGDRSSRVLKIIPSEFQPLQLPQIQATAEGDDTSLDHDDGGFLGMNEMLGLSAIDKDYSANERKPSLPPIFSSPPQLPALDISISSQATFNTSTATDAKPEQTANHSPARQQDKIEPLSPVVLTRGQKVNKALEKLELLDFRKVSVRVYVQDANRYYSYSLSEYTTCEMLLNDMKKSGIIDPDKTTWALFELVHYFGIERPLTHFENVMSVVEGWEPRSNNYLVVKGFAQQSSLSMLGGVHPGDHAIQGMLYYRVKKNKWQKGTFRLQGHSLTYVKDGRGKSKQESQYLTLAKNDIFTPFKPLRSAPSRFVFGLKSEMPMQMFEKPDEDYVKWFAVPTLDSLREWLLVLRLAKNQIKFCQALERRVVETSAGKNGNMSGPAGTAFPPLVGLAVDKTNNGEGTNGKDKMSADFAAELVSSINKIATSSKHDPSVLVRAVEQGGVDVSDFKILRKSENGSGSDNGDEDGDGGDNDANLFLPGSLLSKPKQLGKAGAEADETSLLDSSMFTKGSLLSQPRESKAMAASKAMQSIMAQNGDVFTHGSLLQVAEEPKERPPHVGGAPNLPNTQYPLVQQLENHDANQFRSFDEGAGVPYHTHTRDVRPLGYYEVEANDEVVFGGLLASHAQLDVVAQNKSNPTYVNR